MHTVVLNADFSYLNTVSWQRAVKLIVKEKAVAIREDEKTVSNADRTFILKIPVVLKLVEMVKAVYRTKVPFSKKSVLVRDKYTCTYCGRQENMTVDHVLPTSRGGKTNYLNCVASCMACNLKKANRTPEEAHMHLTRAPYEPSMIEFLKYRTKLLGVHHFLEELGIY